MAGSTAVAASSSSGTQPQSQPAAHIMSARVRKTIQSIKEIVGNFSDADIYIALKESNMDPNETAQKLLSQDPFHEVRRRKDRKKETMGYRGSGEFRRGSENFIQGVRTFNDRNGRRGGYIRNAVPSSSGPSREFRVVRDNRVNGTINRELKSDFSESSSSNEHAVKGYVCSYLFLHSSESTSKSSALKASAELGPSQATNGPTVSQGVRHNRDGNLKGTESRANLDEKRAVTPGAASRVQGGRPNSSQNQSTTVVGVYSSSTDPVHVPSPDARPTAAVGAIKREVGVVGGRRQNIGSPIKDLSADSSLSEPFQPFLGISKNDQVSHQANASEAVASGVSVSRSFLGGQYNSRPHQQAAGHQKAPQHNKEWKPKTSKKSSANGPGVIGTPKKSSSHVGDNSKGLEAVAADLPDKFSRANINENQNVIIAQHIRVPETDRCRLTFGSFGIELDSPRNLTAGFSTVGVTEESNRESTTSLTASVTESTGDDASGTKIDAVSDEKLRHSGSASPASGGASEPQLPDKSPSSPNLDNYSDIGLVQESSPSYDHIESHQQHQDLSESQSFQGYDPQVGYGMSYFRPSYDETARGQQGLPSPQESLASHTAHSIPSSTISMVQQQQPQPIAAQMYQQVHMPHFANMMPFRQFVSPVYLPQMAMAGYSSNAAAYAHPSNGSSYVLMPGGGSHLNTNGLKYGVQQFKTVPGSSPSAYGNFTSPTGYAMNAPGVVGNGTGLEDPSRIKYKDGNLYVTNPQAETSEMWIQNPRDLPGMQSAAQYYNMTGQSPHAAAYLPSHAGHASFNAAAAQSSHMQYPGLYPSAQPAGMANPHHMGPPVMGGGVGVAQAAPGGQVGAYQQQPQLGHLNWTTNF
ncbi:unnamed protein product [Linum tenue]|uniref:GBF-interacting protein 1 N-terminal domain-containing protein n=2 Tax=Linum tenue TaxID=586396 RepID=A0AAV0KB25_9ROSI|nr:unnamed protein product [Linum tenue]